MIDDMIEFVFANAPRVGLLSVVLFVVWWFWLGVVAFRADAQCLRAGYREASVTWNGGAYCVKRLDQTDVVMPLDSVKK